MQLLEPDFPTLWQRLVARPKTLSFWGQDADLVSDEDDEPQEVAPVRPLRADEMRGDPSGAKLNRLLYNLRSKSNLSLEEQGLTTLYVAWGFLEWRDPKTKDSVVSPLILSPVTLLREGSRAFYRLKLAEEDLWLNPVLAWKLQSDFQIALPELPPFEDAEPLPYFQAVRALIADKYPDWSVIEEAYLGLFSFHKMAMYSDLNEGEQLALANPFVRALGGDPSRLPVVPGDLPQGPDLDELPVSQGFGVLDCDSSQNEAVQAAGAGVSFVLQGPPGTGKSQTIANIIAHALGHGKRVLFVSEKMAALDVVHGRLESVGLSPFCLKAHSQGATKKEVIADLGRTLALAQTGAQKAAFASAGRQDAAESAELERLRDALNRYARELHLPRSPLNQSVYEAAGELALRPDAPEIAAPLPAPFAVDGAKLSHWRELLERAQDAREVWQAGENHPWHGAKAGRFSLDLLASVRARGTGGADVSRQIARDARELGEHLGAHSETFSLAQGQALVELGALMESSAAGLTPTSNLWSAEKPRLEVGVSPAEIAVAAQVDAPAPRPPVSWFVAEDLEGHLALAGRFKARFEAVRARRAALGQGWKPEFWALDLADLIERATARHAATLERGGTWEKFSDWGDEVTRRLERIAENLEIAAQTSAHLAQGWEIAAPQTLATIALLANAGIALQKQSAGWEKVEARWFERDNLPILQAAAEQGAKRARLRDQSAASLEPYDLAAMAQADLGALAHRYEADYRGFARVFKGQFRRDARQIALWRRADAPKLGVEATLADLKIAARWQGAASELESAIPAHRAQFGRAYAGKATDWEAIEADLARCETLATAFAPLGGVPPTLTRALTSALDQSAALSPLNALCAALAVLQEELRWLPSIFSLRSWPFQNGGANLALPHAPAREAARWLFAQAANLRDVAAALKTLAGARANPASEVGSSASTVGISTSELGISASEVASSTSEVGTSASEVASSGSEAVSSGSKVEVSGSEAVSSGSKVEFSGLKPEVAAARALLAPAPLVAGAREGLEVTRLEAELEAENAFLRSRFEHLFEGAQTDWDAVLKTLAWTGAARAWWKNWARLGGQSGENGQASPAFIALASGESARPALVEQSDFDRAGLAFSSNLLDSQPSRLEAGASPARNRENATNDRLEEGASPARNPTREPGQAPDLNAQLQTQIAELRAHWTFFGAFYQDEIGPGNSLEADALWFEARVAGAPQLEAMRRWLDTQNELQTVGLWEFWQGARRAELSDDEISQAFERRFWALWIDAALALSPVLADFAGARHEAASEKFCALDAASLGAAQRRLGGLLWAKKPVASGHKTGEIAILQKEVMKKARQKPIRRLFREIPHLLGALKPCLLMSPLAVAQFLEAGRAEFDLVIFDEASQICPEDAVGAILRSHQLIVVGDRKQLPPTRFFAAGGGFDADEDDENDADATLYESILDMCAPHLPNTMLLWHYRSRDEALISFSNRHFYDGRLITFPGPMAGEGGVRLERVEGVYLRGKVAGARTNPIEAQRVADLIIEHLERAAGQTLGVIALNSTQARAIDEALWERLLGRPDLETALRQMREPVFIKALENVQGDERDAIILSIGYGPDAAGKVSMNFGPLNKIGGERRLNVAVTRARDCLTVVSSLGAEQIDAARTNALGPKLLRSYLEMARRGGEVSLLESGLETDALVDAVEFALAARGWKTTRGVGRSALKIDIAVEHPQRAGEFVLGIECDGGDYASAPVARDRERLRPAVLNNLGWNLERVWSLDWLKNPDGEIARLKAALNAALNAPDEETEIAAIESAALEQSAPESEPTLIAMEIPAPSIAAPAFAPFAALEGDDDDDSPFAGVALEWAATDLGATQAVELHGFSGGAFDAETGSSEVGSSEAGSSEAVSSEAVSSKTVSSAGVSPEAVSSEAVSSAGVSPETRSREAVSSEAVSSEVAWLEAELSEGVSPDAEPETRVYQAVELGHLGWQEDFREMGPSSPALRAAIWRVAEQEAPLRLEALQSKIARAWDFRRVGDVVGATISLAVQGDGRLELRGAWVWKSGQSEAPFRAPAPGEAARPIEWVCPAEIADAALFCVRAAIGLERDELVRQTAKVLGYNRVGAQVNILVSAVVAELLERGQLIERAGAIGLGES